MKELSIEEKAKRYDEVIERAKKEKEKSRNLGLLEFIEETFPEFAESEDERIVKELLTFFRESMYGGHILTNKEYDSWIAWLEKQCEQKSKKISLWKHWKDGIAGNGEGKIIYLVKMGNTYRLTSCLGFECDYIELSELDNLLLEKQGEQEPKFRIGDTIKKKSTGDIVTVSEVDLKNREYRLSNTGFIPFKYEYLWELVEQKPVFEMKTPEESLGIDSDTYNKIVDECIYGDDEKKQTIDYLENLPKDNWELVHEFVGKFGRIPKDEDELNVLVEYILKRQKPTWSEEDERTYKSITYSFAHNYPLTVQQQEFVKSLKDRVQPQNKWKESLATADLENSLCDIQDGFSDTSYEYRTLGEAIEFIRCTEPTPHWKPSDEQMTQLGKCCPDNRSLTSLYEQLKKLRDE